MSRLAPYRAKAPDSVRQRIDETLATTFYLVQTSGPTSYVVQEQHSDKKHKVLVGALQSCSCGDADVCIHVLFVMLKVLRVPATTPIVWQKSLIDSEIDALLRGDYREKSRASPPKHAGPFLKRQKKDENGDSPADGDGADATRHELVEGEVCAICQEEMAADQPLTFCRKGCGNNFHIECMKVFGESRKQSKEHLICPLCRHDWGDLALTELRKEMEVANKAPNVHKGVGCKNCQTKPIRNERYRCVQCKSVDLCDRCFKMNAHINHSFVMKKLVSDAWIPAPRSTQQRSATVNAELAQELQGRELTTNDYDLLLQLDQQGKHPIQDYLLSTLGGQRIAAANTKSFGEQGASCCVCRQSLRIQADVRQVICGHAFHESCLARSILSQVYTCPNPSCGHVLFPGLHYLTTKSKPSQLEDPPKPSTASVLDPSFCVMPLHNQQQVPAIGHLSSHDKRPKTGPKPTTKELNVDKPATDIAGLSIGHAPQHLPLLANLAAKPTSSFSRTHRVMSRETHSRCSSTSGCDSSSTGEFKPFGQEAVSTEDRLKHAKDLRSELKNLDKERLRKQRLQREERVRQNLSNNETNHAALNGLLPPVGRPINAGESPLPAVRPVSKANTAADMRRKANDRGESRQVQQTLPELSIGAIRRGY